MDDEPSAFEERAVALARAIHDPLGLQGSRMVLGRERDAVFVDDDAIHAFEFTTDRSKKKAEKDATKLVELLKHLANDSANTYKSLTGWFVTQHEPEAEQREAVRKIAKDASLALHCISYITLRKRVCDVEGYLAARLDAPFGSIAYAPQSGGSVGVPPKFQDRHAALSLVELVDRVAEGERVVLTGEFGVGKSYALREVFYALRKRHFKSPASQPFPIHINLRDCAGLKTPAEVLRRHAEEIGFSGDRGLVSAWRSGSATLLLDGFDEVIPNRWLGSGANLRQVRWDALSVVRRLTQESPRTGGVLLAGRGHYFASDAEMSDAIGLHSNTLVGLEDFDAEQAQVFLNKSGTPSLPDWLPTRPLLLSHLLSAGLLDGLGETLNLEPSRAWRELLQMIASRESNIYPSVPPETILALLRRLATVARSRGDVTARLGISDLENVFTDVSGRSTDEEVLQLLLRLPGLAVADAAGEEVRVFADAGLASAAYGEDLAAYLSSPYQGHPLCESVSWSDAADDLAIDVASLALGELSVPARQIVAACDYRAGRGKNDAVLFDGVRVADALPTDPGNVRGYIVDGLSIGLVSVDGDARVLPASHIRDSVIELLDMTQADIDVELPTFERCFIARIEGVSELPARYSSRFIKCEVESYSARSGTTSGIMGLGNLSLDDRVALTILHKVYIKRGAGRKDSALRRGLEPAARERVPGVVDALVSAGLLVACGHGTVTIYRSAKGRHGEVGRHLSAPSEFSLAKLTAQ